MAVHLRVPEDVAHAIDLYRTRNLPGANRQDAVRDLLRRQLALAGLMLVDQNEDSR